MSTNLAWFYVLATNPEMAQIIVDEETVWQLENRSGAAMVSAMRKSDRWGMWSNSQFNRVRREHGQSIVQAVTDLINDRDIISIY